MQLKTKDQEFSLAYKTGSYLSLKKALKSENLVQALFKAANKNDLEKLAAVLFHFSDGKLARTESAHEAIDNYLNENACTAYQMWQTVLHEVSEAGFFKEQYTMEQVLEKMESPEDFEVQEMGEGLMQEMMQMAKKRMMDQVLNSQIANITQIIPTTSANLEQPVTAEA